MKLERQKALLIQFSSFGLIAAAIYLSIKYLLPLLLPFVGALAVVMLLRPFTRYLVKKRRMHPKTAGLFTLLLFYSTIGLALFFIITELYDKGRILALQLPTFYDKELVPYLHQLSKQLEGLSSVGPFAGRDWLDDLVNAVLQGVGSFTAALTTWVVEGVSAMATELPKAIFSLTIGIICSLYLAADWDVMVHFLQQCLPQKWMQNLFRIKQEGCRLISGYLRSYAILMGMTFVELLVGFLLLRVPKAALIALAIALFDVLPVFGTGGILIPWILIVFLQGNYTFGIGLTVLYAIVTVIRNLAEPKLLGKQTGLHPVVMLLLLFVGGGLFGIWGLLLLPITASMIWSIWIRRHQQEEDTEKTGKNNKTATINL